MNVNLPKKVAETIDQLRGAGLSNADIVYAYASGQGYRNDIQCKILADYSSDNFDTFLKALVNGYEVEQTPEEEAIQWLIRKNCIQRGFSEHDIVMGIKNILNRGGTKNDQAR